MNIQCDNTWPLDLPLPVIDYTGKGVYSTVQTDINSLVPAFRSRFKKNYPVLTLSWMLTLDQYNEFKSFFRTTLSNGTAQFTLLLRFPYNSALVNWVVRFADSFRAQNPDVGWWSVTAEIELVTSAELLDDYRIEQDDDLRLTMDGEIRQVDYSNIPSVATAFQRVTQANDVRVTQDGQTRYIG